MKFKLGDLIEDRRMNARGLVVHVDDHRYQVVWFRPNNVISRGSPSVKYFESDTGPWGQDRLRILSWLI